MEQRLILLETLFVGTIERNSGLIGYTIAHDGTHLRPCAERGETTHRLMAQDLDISPLAAEMILQALRPVVDDYYEIEEAGTSLEAIGVDERDTIDDA